MGGPLDGASQTFTLTNAGNGVLNWSLVNTSAWLTVSNSSGALAIGTQTNITVSLNSTANSLAVGNYAATVIFSNQTTHVAQARTFSLQVLSSLVVSPAVGFTASGPVGGNFSISTQNYGLTNLSAAALNWGLVNTSAWLTVSATGSSLAGGASTNLAISLAGPANTLAPGIYAATVLVTNQGVIAANLAFGLQVGQSLVQNGGFETGDFTGWSQSGNTAYTSVTSGNASYVHSGTYGVQAGPGTTAGFISQSLATSPGQSYLLSFWIANPTSGTTEQLTVNWKTNAAGTNQVYSLLNPGVLAWTNLNLMVTAAGTNTTLQFSLRNDPAYFGLDDISVTPIPLPTFTGFIKTNNAFMLNWNSLAGVAYQIQYKTNLLQTNWINLATNTATANSIRFTNLMGADPRRFYRVHRLP